MKLKKKKIITLFLAGICCLSTVGGCASGGSGQGEADISKEEGTNISNEEVESENPDVAPLPEGTEDPEENVVNIGEFSMKDIYGDGFDQKMFADYQLTMVNVFATWCGPCINEIPDLEKLSKEMADQEVNVVGIVLDAIDASGTVDEEAVEKAKLLAEKLEVTYPFLIPDESYLNGILLGISAVPTTFFVDQEGNLVGEVYLGSHSLEDWTDIVGEQLKGMTP